MNVKDNLSELRKEYTKASIDPLTVNRNPFKQFEIWFIEAQKAQLPEPNAMVASTSGKENKPSSRTVLLKAFDENGFVFFTNYTSRKATQIAENAYASLLFPWFPIERQVIIEGSVERISRAETAKYFLSRPFGSQLGAWVSNQSQVISSRKLLEMKWEEMKSKFKDGKIPVPDQWGGFRVNPGRIEFWQGGPNRLHDRVLYSRQNTEWKIERLAP